MPLGEGVLGMLVGASLLSASAPACAAVTQPPGEQGVPAVGRIFNPSVWPDGLKICPTDPFASALAGATPAPARRALSDLFAPAEPALTRYSLFEPAETHLGFLSPDPAPTARPAFIHATPSWLVSAPNSDVVLLTALAALQLPTTPATPQVTPALEAQLKENFGKLPLSFEQNVGQTDASVHFFGRGPGYALYLTSTEAVMVLNGRTAADAPPAVVRMQVLGGNAAPRVTGDDQQPGKVNYFLGNDPAQWHTNISTFGRVEYDEVYRGIDLVWYGNQDQLEYDFVVGPGADPSAIRLNISGAERVEIDGAGNLVMHAGDQELRQHAPFVYQEVNSARQEVASRFALLTTHHAPRTTHQVSFAVGAYDAGRPLVIDPVLSYSTYLGGSGGDDVGGIAVDPSTGEALVTGSTFSADFPTADPYQPALRGPADAFVARLRADGRTLAYATYLGGGGADQGHAIAVNPATGGAFITGETASADFPTVNAFQPNYRGSGDTFTAWVQPDGAALVFSTYLGGSRADRGLGIAVDPASGAAFLTGGTTSTDFPSVNAVQGSNRGNEDAFVARISDRFALLYSTYLGGGFGDYGTGVAVDPATGNALVTGGTNSFNFLTVNALLPNYRGLNDGFVARLTANGGALVYSTYLGGSNADYGHAIDVDPLTGAALVTGLTASADFPTVNPLQPALRGPGDAFVTRLRADGRALLHSTYLGGSGYDYGEGLALDPLTGDALITGSTLSADFPTVDALQPSLRGPGDAFVTRLRAGGAALAYSTYLGGGAGDSGSGIAFDPFTGDALVTGVTVSTDFPTTAGAFDRTCGTDGMCNPSTLEAHPDAFVTRIGAPPATYYYVYPDSGQAAVGVPFDLYVIALDAQFNVIPDYTGLILFYATDPLATTPSYYQFQRTDGGVASFPGGLTFYTPGVQALYVLDWPGFQVFGYAAFQVV